MPSMCRRSRMNTSCVEPGQMATRLPFRSFSVAIEQSLRATTAMPLLQDEPNTTTGSCAAAPRMPRQCRTCRNPPIWSTTASLPSVGLSNGMICDAIARRHEAFIEPRRDGVDQLQRADADGDRIGRGGARTQHDRGGKRGGKKAASAANHVRVSFTAKDAARLHGACPAARLDQAWLRRPGWRPRRRQRPGRPYGHENAAATVGCRLAMAVVCILKAIGLESGQKADTWREKRR